MSGARQARRGVVFAAFAATASLFYIAAYTIAYATREPAMNMAYWVYRGPDCVDGVCYAMFWPVYRCHRAIARVARHNLDREPSTLDESP